VLLAVEQAVQVQEHQVQEMEQMVDQVVVKQEVMFQEVYQLQEQVIHLP
jgi:hypothetical protein